MTTTPFDWTFDTFQPTVLSRKVDHNKCKEIIIDMIQKQIFNKVAIAKYHSALPTNIELLCAYSELVKSEEIKREEILESKLKIKATREVSGVLVFTVVMSDKPNNQDFTCKYDCHFCPKQPNVARSYLLGEPAVARGYQNGWNPIKQIRSRMQSYLCTGSASLFDKLTHKIDIVVEGGTYTSYPKEYRVDFIRDLFYACNTIYDNHPREKLSLHEEMFINEKVIGLRITGLSIETRPDTITNELCRELRECGITKVQLGVQTCFDSVLKLNNRGHKYIAVKRATTILVNNAFKIQIHLMPDMYGSNEDMDKQMFEIVFNDHEISFDHIKVYPTMILDYTEIKKLYDDGVYHPYGADKSKLMDVMLSMVKSLNTAERYDIRTERVIRDIPAEDILGGCDELSMGQELHDECKRTNLNCICVRCREVGRNVIGKSITNHIFKIVVRSRNACEGIEYFISVENEEQTVLYGLLRLRIPLKSNNYFQELNNAGLIREVHVYNLMVSVGSVGATSQHIGLGSMMVKKAEEITLSHSLNKIAVISGVGVKDYYMRKHNFVNDGLYLTKRL